MKYLHLIKNNCLLAQLISDCINITTSTFTLNNFTADHWLTGEGEKSLTHNNTAWFTMTGSTRTQCKQLFFTSSSRSSKKRKIKHATRHDTTRHDGLYVDATKPKKETLIKMLLNIGSTAREVFFLIFTLITDCLASKSSVSCQVYCF